ncbi:hypothetical protein [Legionella bononiensis]|uniref:Uncharacterized protein n=1 Tax=Legionella bononiensis TaxID=2793102 RepID=A0ABS1W715_9GAMM|nr:hypothetical protein [Legionella bononiensis]MBL7481252.1 hypothetical protein [Legionella bononiensis]MBL7525158.1 hypothetical protein [Legionella bononiensis]MBL7562882.1 hypothetical protein [Legionella bononiensis]
MQALCRFQEFPHYIRDDVPGDYCVILNAVKDLQMQALCRFREFPHYIRDDVFGTN